MLTFIIFTILINTFQVAFIFSTAKLKNISWLFYILMCFCYSYGFFNYNFINIFTLNLLLATIGYINFNNNTISIKNNYIQGLLVITISILLIYTTLTKDLMMSISLLVTNTDISFLYLKFIFDSLEIFGYVILAFRYFYGIIFISLKALWLILSYFPYLIITGSNLDSLSIINLCFSISLTLIVIFQFKKARKLYSNEI